MYLCGSFHSNYVCYYVLSSSCKIQRQTHLFLKSRTYEAAQYSLELAVDQAIMEVGKILLPLLLRAGIKSIFFPFYCILFVTISNYVDWTKGYILFSIQVLYGVFCIVFLQQAGRGQKTFMGEFSLLNLAPRDWDQFTGFVSFNICSFFFFFKLRNCVWV